MKTKFSSCMWMKMQKESKYDSNQLIIPKFADG